jgi:hypothetical protein
MGELTCKQFVNFSTWNELAEGTEKGFDELNGYYSWQCKGSLPCKVTNENGNNKEGTYATDEGPPTIVGGKASRSGNTSAPWSGELPQKGNESYKPIHHAKIWIVVPLPKSLGGPGEGQGCELLGGSEIGFADLEGATEKEAGDILTPKWRNGTKNGLNPSHMIFTGDKTAKNGNPETGVLIGKSFGALYVEGELLVTGWAGLELVTIE